MDFRTLLILLLIAVVLFGAKKLPDLARSIGRSARILKSETKGFREDEESSATDESSDKTGSPQGTQAQAYDYNGPAAQPQQAGYAELPPGQYVVDENGQPVRRQYGS
ncbi:sec-independent protein translocase protein TatA [Lipingzhangella halophila]|uniref:Sec-independent protein translocase protein TatA n=1 Tax=Lipingzhangella halophila TaxID=1783352 RepID=A0A7W7RGF8_9ACTN|nr:Sec-independent protein translocase subunit TatA [Lipingzhangella halophila]MBB4931533.1 sec-independent protein translocase protein TatA [Lipingzhangella halophila]